MIENMPAQTKHVWILDEGSQGHLVQSRGLVRELATLVPLRVSEVPVHCRLSRGLARSLVKRLLRWLPSKSTFRMLYPRAVLPQGAPDLLVASGPHALPALEFLSKSLHCPSVFVQGTLRIPKGSVDVIMRPHEGEQREDFIFVPMLFTEVTPETLARAEEEFLLQIPLRRDRPLYALFIGDSSAKIRFSEADWLAIAHFVNDLARRDGARWLITTSARSSCELEELFQRHIDPGVIAHAVWYRKAPHKVTKAYLGMAERVFVTMDSLTMLTEAVASGKPSCALCPAIAPIREGNTHLHYIESLARDRLVTLVRPALGEQAAINPLLPARVDYAPAVTELSRRLHWKP
jgi:mitochondrial fission protein ELM1